MRRLVPLLCLWLAACGIAPRLPETAPAQAERVRIDREKGQEVVLHALSLIDTGYRFGGRNPEAGLDCSGMVSYIYEQVAGVRLPHNAAQIAQLATPVSREQLEPGDLVFFNTQRKPFSHVGIYIGDGRFVHAPSTNGHVRIESLANGYFAPRFEGGRTFFAN